MFEKNHIPIKVMTLGSP